MVVVNDLVFQTSGLHCVREHRCHDLVHLKMIKMPTRADASTYRCCLCMTTGHFLSYPKVWKIRDYPAQSGTSGRPTNIQL